MAYEVCYMTPSDAVFVRLLLWFLQLYLQNVANTFWDVNNVLIRGIEEVNKGKHKTALDVTVTEPMLKHAGSMAWMISSLQLLHFWRAAMIQVMIPTSIMIDFETFYCYSLGTRILL